MKRNDKCACEKYARLNNVVLFTSSLHPNKIIKQSVPCPFNHLRINPLAFPQHLWERDSVPLAVLMPGVQQLL